MAQQIKRKYLLDGVINKDKLDVGLFEDSTKAKLNPDLMPNLAITDVYVVSDEAKLSSGSLTDKSDAVQSVRSGDVAIVEADSTEGGRRMVYMWTGSSWEKIKSGDSVTSVNSQSFDDSGNVLVGGEHIVHNSDASTQSEDAVEAGSLSAKINELSASATSDNTALQTEINNIESAVGLGEDGTFVSLTNLLAGEAAESFSAFADEAPATVKQALEMLDKALSSFIEEHSRRKFKKEKITLTQDHLDSGITLMHAPEADSLKASVGRLVIHETDDYSVSGSTLTFSSDYKTGADAPEVGEIINVTYRYLEV